MSIKFGREYNELQVEQMINKEKIRTCERMMVSFPQIPQYSLRRKEKLLKRNEEINVYLMKGFTTWEAVAKDLLRERRQRYEDSNK